MSSKLHTVYLILFALARPAAARPQTLPAHPLSLREAVNVALQRNPEVLIAEEQLAEIKGRIHEVRADALPQVSLSGFGLRLRDPSFLNSASFDNVPEEFRAALVPRAANLFDLGVRVTQPLYTAGKVGTAIRLAQEGLKEKEAALESARQAVAFGVFQAFHDVLLAEENLEVIRETQKQRQHHLELARSRFAEGVATEIDVLRSEVNLANMDPELIRANNSLELARSTLNSLMVVDLESPVQIVGRLEYHPSPLPGVELLRARAMEVRPEILVARRLLGESKLLLDLAHAENKLSVDLEGRYGYTVREPENLFDSNFASWNVTLNFKLPFYDGGRKAGQVAQASARVRAAEQSLARLENDIKLEIKAAHDALSSSAKAIEAASLNVTQAERVLEMMQANYRYGAATTLDVLDSQTALTAARNARITATYEHTIAKARLRLAVGIPILQDEVVP